MIRRGFTLVEVLASVALASAIAITAATWTISLHRSARRLHQAVEVESAVLRTALRLRQDVLYASADSRLGQREADGAYRFTVTTPHGSERTQVAWKQSNQVVTRSWQTIAGGPWHEETIADGIDTCTLILAAGTSPVIHVQSGDTTLSLPVLTQAIRVPR
jgi:prepilin-type N-terminal cleavage/methylation domain-containing protein